MDDIRINIVYEDNHLLVVEKPVNIPSQSDKTGDKDLLTILKEDIKQRSYKRGNVYLALIHRLDRPAGGVMVFAKTSKAAGRLSDQIRGREFKKFYYAVIHGVPEQPKAQLVHYLKKIEKLNFVRVVSETVKGSKQAILDYNVIKTVDELTLVRVELLTGRTHQIRVQFSAIGHPLYGDQKYGVGINKPGQQLALWATEVSFKHPITKEVVGFKSIPPKDMYPWSLFSPFLLET